MPSSPEEPSGTAEARRATTRSPRERKKIMKAPKAFAAVAASAAAICLAAGLAFAVDTPLPTEEPAPAEAQDTSITKQVAVTIVYQDEKEADSMAAQLEQSRNDALAAIEAEANDGASTVGTTIGTAKALQVAKDAVQEKYGVSDLESEKTIEASTVETTAPGAMEADTIDVNGTEMAYVPSYKTSSAPSTGAGLWMGSDSTTDGTWGYFIGHNPGAFTCVMSLKNGDPVTVCDSDGQQRTYHVVDEFIVPDSTYWEDIQARVTTYGESIILQTCCGDNAHYRVVVAD